MNSFYGGLTGQHFKFSAIFPSRAALKEDLKQTMYSPIGLDEFVLVSYGIQNLTPYPGGESDTVSYIVDTIEAYPEGKPIKQETIIELNNYYDNRTKDIDNYGRSFNSTLWQKVYKSDLTPDKENRNIVWYKNNYITISDIENGENNYIIAEIKDDNIKEIEQTLDYCYICLGSFTGTMPVIEVISESLAPANEPIVSINNTNIDKPIVTFGLPEAVEFFWNVEVIDGHLDKLPTGIKNGDYIISTENNFYLYNGGLDYKGNFVPTFKDGETKYISAFGDNGERNQIKIELIDNHKFDYTIPNLPEVSVEATTVEAGEPARVEQEIISNSNNIKFKFSIPQGEQGIPASPSIVKTIDIKSTIPGENNSEVDILEIITPQTYPITSQEMIYVNYILDEDNGVIVGYAVVNPNNSNIYDLISLSGSSTGSGYWEELE